MESVQHPLHSIGKNIEPNPAGPSLPPVYTGSGPKDQRYDHGMSDRPITEPVSIPKSVNLAGIKVPAMMLDNDLRVVWLNKPAFDQIWHNASAANNSNPTPLIFDLLFDPQFQHAVDNWRRWISFFVNQVIEITPKDKLQRRIDQMKPKQKSIVSALVERILSDPNKAVIPKGRLRQTLGNGEIRSFNSISIDFNEGRLLTFEPVTMERKSSPLFRTYDIEQRFERVSRQPNPVKVTYNVLCATLNQSASFNDELLSFDYCSLMNDLCNRCITIVERFGGIFGRHADSGYVAYFLPTDEYGNEDSLDVLKCALELRALMVELTREWKLRKTWSHEISLNIGIHRETEYLGILATSLGDSLTSFGNAFNRAADLSRLAQNGQIWVSKALINELTVSARNQLRFGIPRLDNQRRQLLLQNSFSKVQDLFGMIDLSGGIFNEIGSMVVTQLIDLKSANQV